MEKFIQNELTELQKIYKDYAKYVNLKLPSLEQVISAATFVPYTEYGTFDSFIAMCNTQFFNVWNSAVRTGYMTGMTTRQIVQNVMGSPAMQAQLAKMGSIQSLRNSVMANTRTALQSFAIQTHNEVFKKNSDLFDGFKWSSVLDRRSCIACGSLDGTIYKTLEDVKEMPPLHLNCRCMILPYIKEFEALNDTRASETGQVDSKITYKDWIENQTEEVKREIMGKGRYELYKNGMEIKDFVSGTQLIPLYKIR